MTDLTSNVYIILLIILFKNYVYVVDVVFG